MQISVLISHDNTLTLEVEPTWDVKQVQELVEPALGYPFDDYAGKRARLSFKGKLLEDGTTLADYNIPNEARLSVRTYIRVPDPLHPFDGTQRTGRRRWRVISVNEQALVIGKCTEALFWHKHRGDGYITEEIEKECISRFDSLKSECGPIMAKFFKHDLHDYAIDIKEKMENDKEVEKVLTLYDRASTVGKCTEVLVWLEAQKEDVDLTDEDRQNIVKRQREFKDECKPIFYKLETVAEEKPSPCG